MGDVIDFTSAHKKKHESIKKSDVIPEKISHREGTEKEISFESEATRFHFLAMVPPAFFVQMDQNKLPFCFPPHPDDEPPLSYA